MDRLDKHLLRQSQVNRRLGENLARIMANENCTQDQLAQYLEVSQSQVSKWINGRSSIPAQVIYQLAFYFDIKVEAFFEDKSDITPRFALFPDGSRKVAALWRKGDIAGVLEMVADRLRLRK